MSDLRVTIGIFNNNKSIRDFLNGFNAGVTLKSYEKNIPYEDWRLMLSADFLKIQAKNICNGVVHYSVNVGNKNLIRVYTNEDKGFGKFLEDYYQMTPAKIYQISTEKTKSYINPALTKDEYSAHSGTIIVNSNPIDGVITNMNNNSEVSFNENMRKYTEDKSVIKKGDKDMKGFNFDFGSCANDNIRMSMYGLAIKNSADTWVSYDSKSGEIIDVDILNFDGRKFMFKLPVAIKDIKPGDIVIHNRVPMFVTDINDNDIKVIDVRAGEKKEIIPTTNMFKFNFITKVVSFFDMSANTASADNPFGNMLPLFLMDDKNDKNNDMLPIIMMMMGTNTDQNFMNNPMMMYFMMKDNSNFSEMMPFFLMGQMNNNSSHTCKCKNKNDNDNKTNQK